MDPHEPLETPTASAPKSSQLEQPEPAYLRHFGCGILMGAADIVPGVSGGTVALILKVYERLVNAIASVNGTLVRLLVNRDFKAVARQLDLRLTLPLALGIGTGVLSLAKLMHYLLDQHADRTNAVFCGLILASTLIVSRRIAKWKPSTIGVFVAGLVVAVFVMGLQTFQNPPDGLWYVFVCGMIGICAMILPGVSGSFLLLVLGKYESIVELLKGIPHGEVTANGLLTIAVFSLGCLSGLLAFSRVLKWLMANHHDTMIALLSGLMLGSLRKLWPLAWPIPRGRESVILVTLFVLATAAILLIDLWSKARRSSLDAT